MFKTLAKILMVAYIITFIFYTFELIGNLSDVFFFFQIYLFFVDQWKLEITLLSGGKVGGCGMPIIRLDTSQLFSLFVSYGDPTATTSDMLTMSSHSLMLTKLKLPWNHSKSKKFMKDSKFYSNFSPAFSVSFSLFHFIFFMK